jgi:iron complex outermembrane receptor protein
MKYFNFCHKILFPVLFIMLFLSAIASYGQQKGTIKGKIVTTKNEPAENVSIKLKGTHHGTISDETGSFEFKVPAGKYILVISHLSLENHEVPVVVKAGEVTNVSPIMVDVTTNSLEEVTIKSNKARKFVKQHSNDVAKVPLDNLENPQVYTAICKKPCGRQPAAAATAAATITHAVLLSKASCATGFQEM